MVLKQIWTGTHVLYLSKDSFAVHFIPYVPKMCCCEAPFGIVKQLELAASRQ